MVGDPGPRRIELPPAVALWDGEHDTSVELATTPVGCSRQRGQCSCGWRGNWRWDARAGWNA